MHSAHRGSIKGDGRIYMLEKSRLIASESKENRRRREIRSCVARHSCTSRRACSVTKSQPRSVWNTVPHTT